MVTSILFRTGMKKHKGSLIGIFFLLFLAALCLCTVLTVSFQGNRYIREELSRSGFGTITAWVSNVPDLKSLSDSIVSQDGVRDVSLEKLIFSSYVGNDTESDSEGQLIPWEEGEKSYQFFREDLSGYDKAPEKIGPGEIYISPSMDSVLGIGIGDTLTFPIARDGQEMNFTVAGYYEDPVMGSAMIGMKGFLISDLDYEEITRIIEAKGSDALAREGAMLHITEDDESGMRISELSRRLTENTSLSQYTEFIHSADTMTDFMSILSNAFCAFLAVFVLVLFFIVLVVLSHSITSMIERDWTNFGILKSLGMTTIQLIRQQTMLYSLAVFSGLIFGMAGAVPVIGLVSSMLVTTSGVLIPAKLPISICFLVLGTFGILLVGFAWVKLKKIYMIFPMAAIRGEQKEEFRKSKSRTKDFRKQKRKIPVKGMLIYLAVRQIFTGKRRYVSACIVAVLLTFFASMAGRMNDWLGPRGQGMMDAFNPADLDIGIQVLGEHSKEEIEEMVHTFSEVTDSYALAMPNVSVNGTNYTANVITEPERFHISRGKTSQEADEVVLTETAAADLGAKVGSQVQIRGDTGTKEFTVLGIYHCANDMGANLGMSRKGYLSIGADDPRIWCYHYFLENPSQKQAITQALEKTFRGDVHIHENTWPGLSGIISAMHLMLAVIYVLCVVFICVVTVLTGDRILKVEQKDIGIYRAVGFRAQNLRINFAVRFGLVAVGGAVVGMLLAALFTDPLVSKVMRIAGISNFSSAPSVGTVVLPGIAVAGMFFGFAYLAAGKIKKEDLSVLTAD